MRPTNTLEYLAFLALVVLGVVVLALVSWVLSFLWQRLRGAIAEPRPVVSGQNQAVWDGGGYVGIDAGGSNYEGCDGVDAGGGDCGADAGCGGGDSSCGGD